MAVGPSRGRAPAIAAAFQARRPRAPTESSAAPTELEALRERFRPPGGVRLLLLGSSPPPGHGFFYKARSTVFECTRRVLVESCGFPHEAGDFLRAFAEAGFFLDDFSSVRGDKPAERPLDPDVRAGVERIAGSISEQQPLVIVGVLQRIERLLYEAVACSGCPDTPWICLPFPNWRSDGTRKAFEAGLRQVIEDFGLNGPQA
jgi:hypothetical protein